MTYPETIWKYSSETEAQRIVFAAQMIRSYFYQKKGFNVLPELANNSVNTVYFPNLSIVHHPYFWERVQQSGLTEGKISPDVLEQLKDELPKNTPPLSIRKEWELIAPKFWKLLQEFLPDVSQLAKKLIIRQTAYGSMASSVRSQKNHPGVITIYLRFDAEVSHIPAALFISTLDHISNNGILKGFTWEERQSVGDFLMRHTSLAALFPHHESTILAIRKGDSEGVRKQSIKYFADLGYPQKQLFGVNEKQQITVNSKNFALRPKEMNVLTLLIEKRNQIVTSDDIASRLWQKDTENHYSLYAISKVIERLRKQVQAVGIYPGIIETRRGQGFVLND